MTSILATLKQGAVAAVFAAVALMTAQQADAKLLASGADLDNEVCSSPSMGVAAGSCSFIVAHPAWEPDNPAFGDEETTSATWISFGPTGYGPDDLTVPFNDTLPGLIYQLFFTAEGNTLIDTKVWADDTALIFVDGVAINAGVDIDPSHNHTCQDANAQTPSCTPGSAIEISALLGAGTTHVLEIWAWQLGRGTNNNSNPFGIMYVGVVQDPSVPEPGMAMALATMLGGMGFIAHRRRVKARV